MWGVGDGALRVPKGGRGWWCPQNWGPPVMGEWVTVPQGSPGLIWSLRTPQPAILSGVTGSQGHWGWWSPQCGGPPVMGAVGDGALRVPRGDLVP